MSKGELRALSSFSDQELADGARKAFKNFSVFQEALVGRGYNVLLEQTEEYHFAERGMIRIIKVLVEKKVVL